MTDNSDPLVIGIERAHAAVRALGITDLDNVQEVTIRADRVWVVRYLRDDEGRIQVDPAGRVLTGSVSAPVVVDEEIALAAHAVVAAARGRTLRDWLAATADDRPTRYAEDLHAAAEACAALPWWRRWLFDWRTRRSEARHRRRARALVEEYRTRGETPPPPDAAI